MTNAEPEAVAEINPADAASRGITDGTPVAVHNELGRIHLSAKVTDDVPVGSVAVPFGRWGTDPGGANSLTSDRLGDLADGPTFCDNLVDVEPAR